MTEEIQITGEFKDVSLYFVDDYLLAFGKLFNDSRGRFTDGDSVRTSYVKKIDFDKKLIYTRNSVYSYQQLAGSLALKPEEFN